ncbi:MAG: zinc metallopeptidase [Pseudobutyrivibrio sp.]|nr:zinc metallopeptidase [Pseudobutyrivibrio sp.]MCF0186084.1 zinc metallopeptidase [Bacteroidaceae bacterium]
MYYYDPTYILVLIGALICGIASLKVKTTYSKYSKIATSRGLTAQDAALEILHAAGIYDVSVERIRGNLTDHYSPTEKVLRLSDSVYNNRSVAAIGVAAHECGHAIQHQESYAPLKLRSLSVPFARFGSMLSWPVIIIGLILGSTNFAQLGVILFAFVVFFQFITLPVEFNASKRALAVLENRNLLYGEELSGARKVLSAAALTYVAALINTLLQMLRLILIVNRRND